MATFDAIALQNRNEKGHRTFPHHLMTDFERFIAHENFRVFLIMAVRVKAIGQCLQAGTVPDTSEVLALCDTRQGEDELDGLAIFIQSKCIPLLENRAFVASVHYVPRGKFVETDGLIDESIKILRQEFTRCMDWYSAKSPSQPHLDSVDSAPAPRTKKSKKGKDVIVVKYSKCQTDILNNWMIANKVSLFAVESFACTPKLLLTCNLLESSLPIVGSDDTTKHCRRLDLRTSRQLDY